MQSGISACISCMFSFYTWICFPKGSLQSLHVTSELQGLAVQLEQLPAKTFNWLFCIYYFWGLWYLWRPWALQWLKLKLLWNAHEENWLWLVMTHLFWTAVSDTLFLSFFFLLSSSLFSCQGQRRASFKEGCHPISNEMWFSQRTMSRIEEKMCEIYLMEKPSCHV